MSQVAVMIPMAVMTTMTTAPSTSPDWEKA
jgi:hypothetical protein